MKIVICMIVLAWLSTSDLYGQKSHLFFGFVKSNNQSDLITTPGMTHTGFRLGVDRRIIGRVIYVIGGAQYIRLSSRGMDEANYLRPKDPLHVAKGRLGIGLTPFAITRFLKYRLKLAGGYSFIVAGHNKMDVPDLKRSYKSVDIGMGITLGIFTLDLEYERGLDGVLADVPRSKFNTWSLSAGLEF